MSALMLILDLGHAGKPPPNERDRGAVWPPPPGEDEDDISTAWRGVVEADLAKRYLDAAERYALVEGAQVARITPGPAGMSYRQRHREAIAIAKASPKRRCLYVQAHLNSADRDARYGLVGYDPRSSGGRGAAEAIGAELERALAPRLISRARAEAAAGGWSRMLATIEGIYAGPGNLSGVCFEPCFIQAPGLEQELDNIASALVDGALRWAAS